MFHRILQSQCSRSFRSLLQQIQTSAVFATDKVTPVSSQESLFTKNGTLNLIWNCCTPVRCTASESLPSNGGNPQNATALHRILPQATVPYVELMRLHKFAATWLLAWPCFWSTALAATPGSLPDLYLIGLFGAGSVVMRSAGCIVNDMWDTDLDKKVERTKWRPLAAERLRLSQSMGLLSVHGILGLSVLFQLNDYRYPSKILPFSFLVCIVSKIVALCSVPFVCTYPLMKRITYWPQLYLGATINWGALVGWAAVHGGNDWSIILPLYTSGIFWTLIYDTIYACQDKVDDRLAGVKSTVLLFGNNVKYWLSGFAVCQATGLILTGLAADCGVIYYASVLATIGHLSWQISSVNINCPTDCMKKFVSNIWLGAILFLGITSDKLFII